MFKEPRTFFTIRCTVDATTGGGGFNTFAFLSFLMAAFNAVRDSEMAFSGGWCYYTADTWIF